jgi:hypothetical protein
MVVVHYYILRQDDDVFLIRKDEDSWRVRKTTLPRIAHMEGALPGAVFHTVAYQMPKVLNFEKPAPLPRETSYLRPGEADNRPWTAVYEFWPPKPLMPEELLAAYQPLTSMQLMELQRLEQWVLPAVKRVELPVLELKAEDVVITRRSPHLYDRNLADHLSPEGR